MTEYVLMIAWSSSNSISHEDVKQFIAKEITGGTMYFNTSAPNTRLNKHSPGASSSDVIAFRFDCMSNFYVFTTFYADQWVKIVINELERLLTESVQKKFNAPITVLCKLMKVIDRGQLGNCNF